jgi:hypothetical protein
MNLQELEQVKKDLADGVIVSRQTWEKVLTVAIGVKKHIGDEQVYSESMRPIEVINEIMYRKNP